MPQAIDLSFASPKISAFLPSSKPIAPPRNLFHSEESDHLDEAISSSVMFQPLTKNLHGLDSQGSGVLFKPTRGPFVTREFGTVTPASTHRSPVLFVRSTPFSFLVMPMA